MYDVNQAKIITPQCDAPLYFKKSKNGDQRVAIGETTIDESENVTMCLDTDGNFVDRVCSTSTIEPGNIQNLNDYNNYAAKIRDDVKRKRLQYISAVSDIKSRVLGE